MSPLAAHHLPVYFRNTQNASTERCDIRSLLSIKVGRQATRTPIFELRIFEEQKLDRVLAS